MNTEERNDPFDDNIGITEQGRAYLRETAKWARFLAIMGFIGMGFMVIAGLFMGTIMSTVMANSPASAQVPGMGMLGGGFIAVLYIILALIYLFPLLYLLRFANRTIASLDNDDEIGLENALMNLKSHYKFIGIFMIVIIGIYILGFAFAILAGIGSSMM